MRLLYLCALLALALVAYVRIAPSNPERWHRASGLTELGHAPGPGSHVYRETSANPDQRFRAVDRVIRTTPRTDVLAGSLDEGMVTYVTRSKAVGFPDYTTLSVDYDTQIIEIRSRLRFGSSDFGVNRTRIEGWLKTLGQG